MLTTWNKIEDAEADGLYRRPTLEKMNEEQLREIEMAYRFGREPRWVWIEIVGMRK